MSETNTAQDGTNFEQEARAQGWRPQEEWTGDPERWVDAKTFVVRAQDWVGVLKKTNEQLRDTMRQMQTFNQKRQAEQAAKHKADEAVLQNQIAQLTAQRDAAMAASDAAQAVQLDRNLRQAETDLAQTQSSIKETSAPTPDPEQIRVAEAFKLKNKAWYGDDWWATKDADEIGMAYANKHPDKPLSEVLDYVEREVFKKYPHYGNGGKKPQGPEGGNNSGVRNVNKADLSEGKTKWEDLDDDTRSIGDRLVATRVFKDRNAYLASLDETDTTIDIAKYKRQ